jgi:hypothetical protein
VMLDKGVNARAVSPPHQHRRGTCRDGNVVVMVWKAVLVRVWSGPIALPYRRRLRAP